FRGGMEAQSKSVKGLLANLNEGFSQMLRGVSDAIVDTLNVRGVIQGLIDHVRSIGPAVVRVAQLVSEWLGGAMAALPVIFDRASQALNVFQPVIQTFQASFRAVSDLIVGEVMPGLKASFGDVFSALPGL